MLRRAAAVLLLIAGYLLTLPAPAQASVSAVDLFQGQAFLDTFAGSANSDPLYGLNVGLESRQTGPAGVVSYTRVSGRNDTGTAPQPWYAQVNQISQPNRLSFHLGTSAVMLGAPAVADQTGSYTVTTTVDPVRGETASGEFAWLALSRSRVAWGYPTSADIDLSLTVSSHGALTLFRGSTAFWSAAVTPAAEYAVAFTVSASATRSLDVTVNGQSFHPAAPATVTRWPSLAYLYLGAYLTSGHVTTFGSGVAGEGLRVSRVDTSLVSSPELFADPFDGAVNSAGTSYGLNDGLRRRQPGVVTDRYTRVSGLWNSSTPPLPTASQVNAPGQPDRLSLRGGTSAVRLDKPVAADLTGRYTAAVTADPITGDDASPDWCALVLAAQPSNGYVTGAEVDLGVLVRSNGHVQVYQPGSALLSSEQIATPAADGSFRLSVTAQGSQAAIVVGNLELSLPLPAAMPASASVYLGAYATSASTVSTFDDLRLSKLGGLSYYGVYDVMDPADHVDHSPEIAAYTNVNHYLHNPEAGFLDYCRPQSCLVETQWQTFRTDPVTGHAVFRSDDAAFQLGLLKSQIGGNLDKVGSIYLIDEPYTKGATPGDLDLAVAAVKAAFPGKVLTLNLFGMDAGTPAPAAVPVAGVDRVGFDHYCTGESSLQATLTWLTGQVLTPYQQVVLYPDSGRFSWCPGLTDDSLKAQQEVYLHLAQNPRVVQLLDFGWWLGGQGDTLAQLPKTAARQREIGQSVLN